MKLLIIGCGSIGKRHIVNAGKISLVGIYDNNIKLSKAVAKDTGANLFINMSDALEWKPNGVIKKWYTNGRLKSEWYYEDGLSHGEHKCYFEIT